MGWVVEWRRTERPVVHENHQRYFILDLMLPKLSGLEILRLLRLAGNAARHHSDGEGRIDDRIAGWT
jgi:DNA-binding response OmpR family regulator